jgi:cytochrome d ubiquinol oxidase subunit II
VLKTEGPVRDRSLRIASFLWKAVILLLAVITVETWQVRPELFSGMIHQPFAWLGLIFVFGGLAAALAGLPGKREALAVFGSCAFIAGLMIAGAAAVFPIMLHSTLAPEDSLSAYQNAVAGHGLAIALFWWPVALIFSEVYFLFVYKHYTGKVKPSEDTQSPH